MKKIPQNRTWEVWGTEGGSRLSHGGKHGQRCRAGAHLEHKLDNRGCSCLKKVQIHLERQGELKDRFKSQAAHLLQQ